MDSLKISFSVALLSVLTLTGCTDGAAGGAKREPVHKVTGKVTMSGAPVANAIVTFSPTGQTPAATGRTDDEGKFVLTTYDPGDGAAAGDYKALVTKEGAAPASGAPVGHDPNNKVAQGGAMHGAQKSAAATGLLPGKYSAATTSDLNVTVKADGANDVTLDLKP